MSRFVDTYEVVPEVVAGSGAQTEVVVTDALGTPAPVSTAEHIAVMRNVKDMLQTLVRPIIGPSDQHVIGIFDLYQGANPVFAWTVGQGAGAEDAAKQGAEFFRKYIFELVKVIGQAGMRLE